MTSLYIISAVLVLILILIFSSIRIRITYDDMIKMSVGYLFLRFKILPSDSKNNGDIKKTANSTKNSPTIQLNEIIDIVKSVLKNLKPLLKSVRIKPLKFDIAVSDSDAATAAIKTGAVNALVWPFVGWLANTIKVDGQQIYISPDYEGEGHMFFDMCIKIKLFHILSAGFNILVDIYKLKFLKDGV